jgi:hypothetical protein
MARGSYRQLHEVVHPELLHIKRQQQQQQQQLTHVLDALRESNIMIERLSAKVTPLRDVTCRCVYANAASMLLPISFVHNNA